VPALLPEYRRGRPTELGAVVPGGIPPKSRPRRGIVRERRWDDRPRTDTHLYVNAPSRNATVDWSISDGAHRTLEEVMGQAGGPGRELRTLTRSLATRLGRAVTTIRGHFRELEAAGWLDRWHDRETNEVILRVSPRLHARPGASLVPEDRKRRVPAP
jgi:hypothetical protein